MELSAPAIGKAGDLRVASELILRGFNPGFFWFDDGIDIVLENGKRIQVKTALRPHKSRKDYSWRYSFSIRQPQFRKGEGGKYERKHTRKDYKHKVDYFIFWCVEHGHFYAVPEREVGERVSLTIPTPTGDRTYKRHEPYKSQSKYEQYRDNWEQLR